MEVYKNEQERYEDLQRQQYYDDEDLPHPMQGSKTISKDESFMKGLFSFRKDMVEPLRYLWSGHIFDHTKGEWHKQNGSNEIMNKCGISWAISLIDSYINSVFVVTSMDEQHMNYIMREATTVVWNSLCIRYKEFGLKKTDIPRIANEIESKILAILMGARGNGYREFFTKQHLIQESFTNAHDGQRKDGMMKNMLGAFFKPRGTY